MLPAFSLSTLMIALPIALITLCLTYFILMPLYRISFYKRKDTVTYFYPVMGLYKFMVDDYKSRHDCLASAKDFCRQNPDHKIFVSNLRNRAVVSLRDPKYIREYLQNPNNYQKDLTALNLMSLMGTGLLLAEGDEWKRHRKIVSSSFNYDFLKSHVGIIQKTTKEFLDSLTPEDYKSYSVIAKIQEITGENVGRIFFGENLNKYTFEGKSLTAALADLISDVIIAARSPIVTAFGPKVMNSPIFPQFAKVIKRVRDFRGVCAQIIQDRKASPEHTNDLLTSLLVTQESKDPEYKFSDEDIINEFVTFFVAGMDTTGHLIGMALYNLTQYPDLLNQLKEEREKTYNQEKNITVETLNKMDSLHSLLKETLRFYTPAAITFTRLALKDHHLADLKIKKGDYVRVDVLSVFFNDQYFENAKEFNPSRWTNGKQATDPYADIPFSGGPRNCIGQHFAMVESKVIMSEFLERFKFSLPKEYKLKMTSRFLYEPAYRIKMRLEPID